MRVLICLLATIVILLEARGGGGGRGGGGFGGGRGGMGGGRGGFGGRGVSGARAAVAKGFSASAAKGFSASARASSFKGISGAAGARTSGFGAGVGLGAASSSRIYVSPLIPIHYGHRHYYWGSSGYTKTADNVTKCEFDISKDEEFKNFTYENGERPKQLVWECPLDRCDPEILGCTPPSFGLLWPVIITTIITLLIPWEVTPYLVKKYCFCNKSPPADPAAAETTVRLNTFSEIRSPISGNTKTQSAR